MWLSKTKVVHNTQSSHFLPGLGGIISKQLYPHVFGEAVSQTQTQDLLLLMEGTSHHTKARPLTYQNKPKIKGPSKVPRDALTLSCDISIKPHAKNCILTLIASYQIRSITKSGIGENLQCKQPIAEKHI